MGGRSEPLHRHRGVRQFGEHGPPDGTADDHGLATVWVSEIGVDSFRFDLARPDCGCYKTYAANSSNHPHRCAHRPDPATEQPETVDAIA
ncbi:MAG: hypothetical protein ACLP3C_22185 [Mycobacterium sp.]|uniref:hypothetical protein n=1 Tax=Mycobacterium sp. TaxID=1785 RepID=UPI003F9D0F41